MAIVMITVLLTSCEEDLVKPLSEIQQNNFDSAYIGSGNLTTEAKENTRKTILELTEALKVIVSNQDVINEIYEAVQGNYYSDNYIGLNDMLNYENSVAYENSNVAPEFIGTFKKMLLEELEENINKYPNLNYFINRSENANSFKTGSGFDFYNMADVTMYIPYLTTDNDVVIDPNSDPTFVPGVIDADSGLGYKMVKEIHDISHENTIEEILVWKEVIVNDTYASENLTIILEPNVLSSIVSNENVKDQDTGTTIYFGDESDLVEGGGLIREVKWGNCILKKQYDKLISFTGNGGGSEIQLSRKDSKGNLEINEDGNVENSQWTTVHSVYFKRKDIRKEKTKWISVNFDTNWEGNNSETYEQTICVWEADTEGNVTASVNLKLKDKDLIDFSFEIGNRSKDEIIHLDVWDVNWFFNTVFLDQGCGFGKGTGAFDREWPIRGCGSNFEYTMLYRWINITPSAGIPEYTPNNCGGERCPKGSVCIHGNCVYP